MESLPGRLHAGRQAAFPVRPRPTRSTPKPDHRGARSTLRLLGLGREAEPRLSLTLCGGWAVRVDGGAMSEYTHKVHGVRHTRRSRRNVQRAIAIALRRT